MQLYVRLLHGIHTVNQTGIKQNQKKTGRLHHAVPRFFYGLYFSYCSLEEKTTISSATTSVM